MVAVGAPRLVLSRSVANIGLVSQAGQQVRKCSYWSRI